MERSRVDFTCTRKGWRKCRFVVAERGFGECSHAELQRTRFGSAGGVWRREKNVYAVYSQVILSCARADIGACVGKRANGRRDFHSGLRFVRGGGGRMKLLCVAHPTPRKCHRLRVGEKFGPGRKVYRCGLAVLLCTAGSSVTVGKFLKSTHPCLFRVNKFERADAVEASVFESSLR